MLLYVILSSCRPRFLSAPVSIQLQVPFINTRTIYEIRERPSRMYSWIALLTSQILIELLWNIIGSTILFLTWYWTIGFENSRAGYTYLMLGIVFPAYYTTFAQVIFISNLTETLRPDSISDRLVLQWPLRLRLLLFSIHVTFHLPLLCKLFFRDFPFTF